MAARRIQRLAGDVTEAMTMKWSLTVWMGVGLLLLASCATGPDPGAVVRSELDQALAYPGLRAFPGLYEITSVDIVRKHAINDSTYEVEAEVELRLLKDVADWVKTDGVGGLGENGFAAYRRFRNAKAGDRFSQRVTYRLVEAEAGWDGQRTDAS